MTRRHQNLLWCLGVFVPWWFFSSISAADGASRCVSCHQGLPERLSKSVTRWQKSAHALGNVGCSDCHGGDPRAVRGGPAHAKFPGHPTALETSDFCGRCHESQRELYRKSGHAKIRGTKPANTCVDCHGAHDVGNPPKLFRLSEYCGSCHGVEYLPALPSDMRKLMEATDRLTDVLKKRFEKPPLPGEQNEAKALKTDVGKLVHAGSVDVLALTVQDWITRMDQISRRLSHENPRSPR